MIKQISRILILILSISIFISGCKIEDPNTNKSTTAETIETQKSNLLLDYTIEMDNNSFTPNKLEAEPGTVISVRLQNEDGIHSFVIDELGIASDDLAPGDEQLIEIEIPQNSAGSSYEFYCGVSNHRALGMTGVLSIN